MALNGRVLLLNQTYEPLGTVSVARAIIMRDNSFFKLNFQNYCSLGGRDVGRAAVITQRFRRCQRKLTSRINVTHKKCSEMEQEKVQSSSFSLRSQNSSSAS